MPVTRHPPYRTLRAELPHTAPTSSIWRKSKLSDAPVPVQSPRQSGFVSGSRLPVPGPSCPASFPPLTSPGLTSRCSPTSPVLCCRPTPRGKQQQAYGYGSRTIITRDYTEINTTANRNEIYRLACL